MLTPSIFKGTMYFAASHNSKNLKSSSGLDNFFATYPVRKGNASSIGKKRYRNEQSLFMMLQNMLHPSSKDEAETKIVLTELLPLND